MKTGVVSLYKDGSRQFEPGVIVCACHDSDHSMIYQKSEDLTPIETREVYLSFCMDPDRKFWARVKNAFRYIFKKERFGTHGEIILNDINISGLEDIVNFITRKDDI